VPNTHPGDSLNKGNQPQYGGGVSYPPWRLGYDPQFFLSSPAVSLYTSEGQLHVLPSEITSEPKLFAQKKSEIDRVFEF
jgi:hypothetical protein